MWILWHRVECGSGFYNRADCGESRVGECNDNAAENLLQTLTMPWESGGKKRSAAANTIQAELNKKILLCISVSSFSTHHTVLSSAIHSVVTLGAACWTVDATRCRTKPNLSIVLLASKSTTCCCAELTHSFILVKEFSWSLLSQPMASVETQVCEPTIRSKMASCS